jgi:predicted nucleic acid-binding protein
MILLDTSAWVEYFKSTEKGTKVKELFYQNMGVYTCPLTLAEISVWCHKNKENPEAFIQKIKLLSAMLELTADILLASGRTYSVEREKNGKIGLIDCIIYNSARFHGLKLWTKDKDFENLVDVELI